MNTPKKSSLGTQQGLPLGPQWGAQSHQNVIPKNIAKRQLENMSETASENYSILNARTCQKTIEGYAKNHIIQVFPARVLKHDPPKASVLVAFWAPQILKKSSPGGNPKSMKKKGTQQSVPGPKKCSPKGMFFCVLGFGPIFQGLRLGRSLGTPPWVDF